MDILYKNNNKENVEIKKILKKKKQKRDRRERERKGKQNFLFLKMAFC